jgi:hypothetical protein
MSSVDLAIGFLRYEGKAEARLLVANKLTRGAGRDITRGVDEVEALDYKGKRK